MITVVSFRRVQVLPRTIIPSRILSSAKPQKTDHSPKDQAANDSEHKNWTKNGKPELIVGFTMLFLLGVDQSIQYYERRQREEFFRLLQLSDKEIRDQQSDPSSV